MSLAVAKPTRKFNGAVELGLTDKFDGHLHGFAAYDPSMGGQDIVWSVSCPDKDSALRIAECVNAMSGISKPVAFIEKANNPPSLSENIAAVNTLAEALYHEYHNSTVGYVTRWDPERDSVAAVWIDKAEKIIREMEQHARNHNG